LSAANRLTALETGRMGRTDFFRIIAAAACHWFLSVSSSNFCCLWLLLSFSFLGLVQTISSVFLVKRQSVVFLVLEQQKNCLNYFTVLECYCLTPIYRAMHGLAYCLYTCRRLVHTTYFFQFCLKHLFVSHAFPIS